MSTIVLSIPISHLIRLRFYRRYPSTSRFSVAVIVPCKGDGDPDFENNMRSIIQQDYDGRAQFIFCVESEQDSAVPVLRALAQRFARVQLCVAGLATCCSQKTFNILQGMAQISSPGPTASDPPEIFVMADSDIQPHSTWLQEMVAPLQDPRISVATGFYRRVPLHPQFRWGSYLAGLFGAFIMTGMTNDRLKGLWGGSLAVRKSVMDQYDLYERFATEIVDDIALMHALHQYGLERRYVPSCTLKSYCDMSVHDSIEWEVRQLQFTQIYTRWLHYLFYLVIIPYALYILAAPAVLLYGLLYEDWLAAGGSVGFWLGVLFNGLLMRLGVTVNPAGVAPNDLKYRLVPWLLLTPVACVLSAASLLKTYFRVKDGVLTMNWRNITYLVNFKDGKVIEVIR